MSPQPRRGRAPSHESPASNIVNEPTARPAVLSTESSALQPFVNDSFAVRAITIDDAPWFIASDVCRALGLANPHSSLALLDEDEKALHSVDTPGGAQQALIVNEPGLYRLILRSRRPEARAFKRWLVREVLPSIRRTGSYAMAPVPVRAVDARQLALAVLDEAARADVAEARVRVLEPAAAAWDELVASNDDFSVRDAAQLLSRLPRVEIGRNRLIDLLRHQQWISADRRPFQRSIERGLMRSRLSTFTDPDGFTRSSITPRLTAAGLAELRVLLLATTDANDEERVA